MSSPRTWGCFLLHFPKIEVPYVFPTHVGVFLRDGTIRTDRSGLPHARGGVSWHYAKVDEKAESSPRTWGCFSGSTAKVACGRVFPTHVGVFLKDGDDISTIISLPHARGGVSNGVDLRIPSALSSPRTWGCFSALLHQPFVERVFPTHVGVFPE